MYKGNSKKVKTNAKKIIRRLRNTDVTVEQLMAEYHCAYETIKKFVISNDHSMKKDVDTIVKRLYRNIKLAKNKEKGTWMPFF